MPRRACSTRRRSGYDETRRVIADWHGKGRNHVRRSRRASRSLRRREQMEAAQRSAREEFPDLHMQTHLSENHDEISVHLRALSLVAIDYTDVYARYGLLGPKSAVRPLHSPLRARGRCHERKPVRLRCICPTSNLFLGSGLFPTDQALARREKARQDRRCHRRRRRLQLFDAAHHGRRLQGDRSSSARRLNPLRKSIMAA